MFILRVINVSLSISYTQELPGIWLASGAVETNSRAGLKANTGSSSQSKRLPEKTGVIPGYRWIQHYPLAHWYGRSFEWQYHDMKQSKHQQ